MEGEALQGPGLEGDKKTDKLLWIRKEEREEKVS